MRVYYTANKERDRPKQAAWKKAWVKANLKKGKCSNCSTKMHFKAHKCIMCYIHHWIDTTVVGLRKSKCQPLLEENLQIRKKVLHQNVLAIAAQANNGYPTLKLGHRVPIRQKPEQALLLQNLYWRELKSDKNHS
jgi:hypothetical protein